MQITASAQPPPLLQIVREPLKPGTEAAFNAIEEERAHLSATLACPHPYLGAKAITGPKEACGSTLPVINGAAAGLRRIRTQRPIDGGVPEERPRQP